ncbi:tetratricopeptide repeat protein [Streptomyces antibioticus]|uniref:tetratricopeptide repeat protein n=1 Tax=Streptomyces antibioticus TaxID=1890 RepID=UPI00224DBB7A|nr:tetratricopeptide repeat protein [Streptomyces antibioticus]MCX4737387.1 tetratricopeptide repeat protein [Streptomyces antibioticus]
MYGLSHETKLDQPEPQPAVAAPLDVHVRADGTATVGGVQVAAADGEEIQRAVLSHLHRVALATGHPVLVTVHDERIGYVVPLRVDPDGASHFTAEPLRTTTRPAQPTAPETTDTPEPRRDLPTQQLHHVAPAPVSASAPGTVAAPTGVFGPPPVMDAVPIPEAAPAPAPAPAPVAPVVSVVPAGTGPRDDPDPRHTPARGFDAVAEAVLGEDPRTLPGSDAPALLGESVAQINEAVRAGRTDTAAALAERTVTEASGTLGPEHPEVLRLRELGAYIAYLAGDPLRSFHASLELARIHRRARDGEAAYGNVQSAATAWRAVRDPFQGLNLGGELIALWTELAAEGGPAADDAEELDTARARMLRLTERARKAADA